MIDEMIDGIIKEGNVMDANLVHIGITVSDIEKISEFYIKYFGFTKGYDAFFDEEFFKAQSALFKQPAGVTSDMQMIKSQNGFMLELFRFSNAENGGVAEWQRTGYNHIAFYVGNLPAICDRMKEDGVEFFGEPQMRSRGDGHWIYLKDPDGNLVEVWD